MSHLPSHNANNNGENDAQQSTPHWVIAVLVGLSVLLLTAAGGQETFTVVVTLEEEQEEEQEEDLGEEGPSVGDLYAFSGPLYDESEDTELGRFDGVHDNEFPWTQ